MKDKPICKPNVNTSDVVKCVVQPSITNCAPPLQQIALDPCIQQHMIYSTTSDPYYQHMPKDDCAKATLYSAQMGGENHEDVTCTIF